MQKFRKSEINLFKLVLLYIIGAVCTLVMLNSCSSGRLIVDDCPHWTKNTKHSAKHHNF